MRKLRTFIEYFLTVTTGIVFIAAFSYSSEPEALTSMTLWQILFAAALCALATTLFFPDEGANKIRMRIGIALHFISLCAIMIVCGRWFGWVGPSFKDAAVMVGYVVVVYAFTTGIACLLEVKQAAAMDRQLQERYHSDLSDETP